MSACTQCPTMLKTYPTYPGVWSPKCCSGSLWIKSQGMIIYLSLCFLQCPSSGITSLSSSWWILGQKTGSGLENMYDTDLVIDAWFQKLGGNDQVMERPLGFRSGDVGSVSLSLSNHLYFHKWLSWGCRLSNLLPTGLVWTLWGQAKDLTWISINNLKKTTHSGNFWGPVSYSLLADY